MANYFSIFLVIVTVASGLIWLADSLLWAPKRKEKLAVARASTQGALDEETLQKVAPVPYIVDTAQQIFPVIAFVLVLRSFLYEPFQIPSGSMMPTLLVGDFILVEKFSYGLKDPVARHKFIETGSPQRGDIVVFKYPEDPNVDFIKRVVGLPGDRVIYRDKQVFIKPACAQADPKECPPMSPVDLSFQKRGEFYQDMVPLERFSEKLGEVEHEILRNPAILPHPQFYHSQPGTEPGEFLVPEGHYFVLGDNRDNSRDSRYWGFVPDENLVGKAVAIWISFEFDRPPSSWVPGWIPTGVRFERIGGIH
ncbi:signal peptidase I [Aliiglaciecola sp. CAU 1673]|uniref:signal peptidase I n=1 Tax=Aliiglaciecola sp. CAU 1673 TaxID=3032595 RepID=UPI0023DA301F|nr:signal peptidase I [Aliiglaciecola sp. CAU 1673]MDF2177999.1 signal peptidase I [Aliiglaciecola sp. CAU 1673]